MRFGRAFQYEHDAANDADQTGHDKRRAPADPLHQQAGEYRSECNAEISHQTIQPDDSTGIGHVLHQHRYAHRVINRREHADQRKPRRELPGVLCKRGNQRCDTHAEEKNNHHDAPAP